MSSKTKTSTTKMVPISGPETDQISRNLLSWISLNVKLPSGISKIDFEYLDEDKPCMAISTIQGAFKTAQYITGGYLAKYPFKLIYRAQPDNNNARLKMDEILNEMADLIEYKVKTEQDKPILGTGLNVKEISCDARASLFGRYENGDEDHQILMTMTYERIN